MLQKYLLLLTITCFSFVHLYAQAEEIETYEEPGAAFFFVMGGKFFYSVNIDLPINKPIDMTISRSQFRGWLLAQIII